MKIYIDDEFRCYATSAEGLREQECSFFDGKSERFIEGYRYVPTGEIWTRNDGVQFRGEMISPIENPVILNIYDDADKQKDRNAKIVAANNEQLQLLEDCIVEMAGVVYAADKPAEEHQQ